MERKYELNNKNVLVIGLAKSGFAAAKVLIKHGANVVVNDMKELEKNKEAKELIAHGIEVHCGSHPLSLLDKPIDFIVKNPGIPYDNPLVKAALEKRIPIYTEVELASLLTEAEIIGITGSNGKTTTTTLLGLMLEGSPKKPIVAGNIGTVLCEVADKAEWNDILVAELSSFQLMGIDSFKPHIGVLLNIFDAHLDYHGSREEYGKAKARLFMNQTEDDFCVYNADDQEVASLIKDVKSTKVPFSTKQFLKEGACLRDNFIMYNDEPVITIKEIVLPGKHSLENILAATAAAKIAGASDHQIRNTLTSFSGVKHRLQYVETVEGVKFYNDSKATNILATQKAIAAFEDPLILLAGGLDRGNEFNELIPYLKNTKALITFGETAPKLMKAAKEAGIKVIEHVDNVEKAVPVAYGYSATGDVVLLSPACASWDQYPSFEQRGDMFIEAVHKLR
ncbi:UDP-N-acetylmuramoyl-L-alanine--D-glutamate ligase [Pseudalkalibacillus salsuginis]|uniref:UDP-N-acetylmuramoyl-L-alanine--D-glutamate ligase n=1 Tax=Pseudalkalibacillus salsuginis TaxID=2910972 RepID=UPI001F321597|nr:UDP-N-acetylmuramoyl-L-alanine--D-glutamate ligase [Pseudalkalibacillus salsuginis]MCF6410469.1 UDP-N-acetylmuramoyl-L-alanine--D-glutamate ligase [Pseudalkalibacillus salsuginis]